MRKPTFRSSPHWGYLGDIVSFHPSHIIVYSTGTRAQSFMLYIFVPSDEPGDIWRDWSSSESVNHSHILDSWGTLEWFSNFLCWALETPPPWPLWIHTSRGLPIICMQFIKETCWHDMMINIHFIHNEQIRILQQATSSQIQQRKHQEQLFSPNTGKAKLFDMNFKQLYIF